MYENNEFNEILNYNVNFERQVKNNQTNIFYKLAGL